jgi:hypothetical protein
MKFNLNTTRISHLNEREKEELKLHMLTLHIKPIMFFIVKVLDEEYTLREENRIDNKKIENFFSDNRFEHIRKVFMTEICEKYINLITDSQWREIHYKYIAKQRRKKLSQLNEIYETL